MLAWDILAYIILVIALFAGLFINILGLPGLWLMVGATALYAWFTWGHYIGVTALIVVIVLAMLAEVVEFAAGAAGSKAAGGSKRGMIGAIVGGIVGGILGSPILPIIGTIIGACLGSFVGAFGVEVMIGRSMEESQRIGIGAAKGRFWGIVFKSMFGIVMLMVAAIAAFPTGRGTVTTPAVLPAPQTQAQTRTIEPSPVPAAEPAEVPTTEPVELPAP